MAYKFPWTNYHELNLDWILNTFKELFAKTEQNNAVVEQYDGRLTEVELTADNAQTAAEQAQQNSTAALDLAQGAQTTATQAQQAAAQAQQAAGQAQTAAGQALEAAATAQQTATQAQQTAQNFDGRITQAENNAANALQAAQAFDEQVQGAVTAANNANEAATNAVTVSEEARQLAASADQKSDRTAAQLNAQINTITQTINSQLDAAETAIENKGEEVLESIPADYTSLSEAVAGKQDAITGTFADSVAFNQQGVLQSYSNGNTSRLFSGFIYNKFTTAFRQYLLCYDYNDSPRSGATVCYNMIRIPNSQSAVTTRRFYSMLSSDGNYHTFTGSYNSADIPINPSAWVDLDKIFPADITFNVRLKVVKNIIQTGGKNGGFYIIVLFGFKDEQGNITSKYRSNIATPFSNLSMSADLSPYINNRAEYNVMAIYADSRNNSTTAQNNAPLVSYIDLDYDIEDTQALALALSN